MSKSHTQLQTAKQMRALMVSARLNLLLVVVMASALLASLFLFPQSALANVENLRPQSHEDVAARTTNETNAYDTDTSTQSNTLYGGNNNTPSFELYNWSSADSGGTTNSLTLEVKYEAQASADNDTYEIEYSLDQTAGACGTGGTWTDLVAPGLPFS